MANDPLTVHTAAITTVSVEIKTLTVSGKQVTLSVFRQLQEQALILRDGTFAGQPWGDRGAVQAPGQQWGRWLGRPQHRHVRHHGGDLPAADLDAVLGEVKRGPDEVHGHRSGRRERDEEVGGRPGGLQVWSRGCRRAQS
jgi:hypothetical protein